MQTDHTLTLTTDERSFVLNELVKKIISEKARILAFKGMKDDQRMEHAKGHLRKLLSIEAKLKAS